MRNVAISIFILLFSSQTFSQGVDPNQVLFGIEYTFQDLEMVNEPGRNTMSTEHKEQKVIELTKYLRENLKLTNESIEKKPSWKPGLYLNVPNDGKWVINSEPVTVEVNTTPRAVHEIIDTAKPIYEAASKAGLKPYVQPAAERSGMGHIHIGARKLKHSPFYKNPLLLRNVMVFLHKNPSLLYGFAEAYDIGMNSNIESYHNEVRQKAFQTAVAEFDKWYATASKSDKEKGLDVFLQTLKTHDSREIGFFEHYRYMKINIEVGTDKNNDGKNTIEFRNFRPPKSPETAKAFAELLLSVMSYQSRDNHLEPFKWVSESKFKLYQSASYLNSNWQDVRAKLELDNRYLDQQINEYVQNQVSKRLYIFGKDKIEILPAYSEKGDKGTYFEVRFPRLKGEVKPILSINYTQIMVKKITSGKKLYWVGIFNNDNIKVSVKEIADAKLKISVKRRKVRACKAII